MKTAWVFPGQGSQQVGMGGDLLTHSGSRDILTEAERILGWSVAEVCAGPGERLDRTLYTQPALFTISVALAQALMQTGAEPQAVAGHSLGEFAALWSVGVFDFATGLKLVEQRARLMDEQQAGTMNALIGFERDQLERLCAERSDVVIANDNHPTQVVISGTPAAVAAVSAASKARRIVPLTVSGAFHSPLMTAAAEQFAILLEKVHFATARVPVLSNTDPTTPTTDPVLLKTKLARQIDHPVRWRETILTLEQLGITRLVEIGPGTVLTGLARKTVRTLHLHNVQDLGALNL